MNKRLYDLTEITNPLGYEFLVDKDGDTEAKSLSIDNLAAYVFDKYFTLLSTAVVKGENVITVTGQATAAYLVLGTWSDSEGGGFVKKYDQTATSFKIYAPAAGTFTYLIKNA